MTLKQFRRWWQDPRSARHHIEDRKVSFLELFYDLAYVGYISQITHGVATHPDVHHIIHYIFLFLVGWWGWFNGSSYHEIHGNDDIRTRVFTFAQMAGIIGMAAFAHSAFETGSTGFILSYTYFQLILAYLWHRTGATDPNHAPMSRPYVAVILISTAIFSSSIFVNGELKYYIWGISLIVSMYAPIASFKVRNKLDSIDDDYRSTVSESFNERMGLFVIIVIGEIIFGIISAIAAVHHFSVGAFINLGFSMLLCFAVWWLYFGFVGSRMPKPTENAMAIWSLGHLPLLIGISLIGSCVNAFILGGDILASAEFRTLFLAAAFVYLVSIYIIDFSLEQTEDSIIFIRSKQFLSIAIVILFILGVFHVPANMLLITITLILYISIFASIYIAINELAED